MSNPDLLLPPPEGDAPEGAEPIYATHRRCWCGVLTPVDPDGYAPRFCCAAHDHEYYGTCEVDGE